jgi:hypothetical protein
MKLPIYTRLAAVAISLLATSAVSQAALIADLGTSLTLGDGSGITYSLTGDIVESTGDDLRFSSNAGGSFTLTFDSAVTLTIFSSEFSTSVNFDDDAGGNSAVITADAGSWAYTAGTYDLTSATETATLGDSALSGLGTSELTISTTRGFYSSSDDAIATSGAVRSDSDWGEITISGVTSLTYVYSNATNYDSLRIDAVAVPEPSAFALLAGLLALVSVAVRRRK